jgi:polyphosphate kinase 2 (PPK2 family)
VRCLPERGRIGLFNRSYYEEVLVVRVHPEFLATQKLADKAGDKPWKACFDDIVTHERHPAPSGTVVRKSFLHVSKGSGGPARARLRTACGCRGGG